MPSRRESLAPPLRICWLGVYLILYDEWSRVKKYTNTGRWTAPSRRKKSVSQGGSDGVVGYHVCLTRRRSRVRFSVRIFHLFFRNQRLRTASKLSKAERASVTDLASAFAAMRYKVNVFALVRSLLTIQWHVLMKILGHETVLSTTFQQKRPPTLSIHCNSISLPKLFAPYSFLSYM